MLSDYINKKRKEKYDKARREGDVKTVNRLGPKIAKSERKKKKNEGSSLL